MIYDDNVVTMSARVGSENGDDRHRADGGDSDDDRSPKSRRRNCNLPRPMRESNFSTTNDDDGAMDANRFDGSVGPWTSSLGCNLPSF